MSGPYEGDSNNGSTPGIKGRNSAAGGTGVWGESQLYTGVNGVGHNTGAGVTGFNDGPATACAAGVWGESQNWEGVHGVSHSPTAAAVAGLSAGGGPGVWGGGNGGGVVGLGHNTGAGVTGFNDGPATACAAGVWGESQNWEGVHGVSHSPTAAAVAGLSAGGGPGVWGGGNGGGVVGLGHTKGAGVAGFNDGPTTACAAGVWGESQNWEGVHGLAHGTSAGVTGISTGGGPGVWATGNPAGHFQGDVEVTGDVRLTGGDCAEQFDITDASTCDPGTVMVIDAAGALKPSEQEYDQCVAGVVTGAGHLRPGLILGWRPAAPGRPTIALVGTVFCNVVADHAPVAVGDLLTTSSVPGHAMKATDPSRVFGAVIGKAMEPLPSGAGQIRILVALQ